MAVWANANSSIADDKREFFMTAFWPVSSEISEALAFRSGILRPVVVAGLVEHVDSNRDQEGSLKDQVSLLLRIECRLSPTC